MSMIGPDRSKRVILKQMDLDDKTARNRTYPNFSRDWMFDLSIKYRLITKLIIQFATNLRDKFFKPN